MHGHGSLCIRRVCLAHDVKDVSFFFALSKMWPFGETRWRLGTCICCVRLRRVVLLLGLQPVLRSVTAVARGTAYAYTRATLSQVYVSLWTNCAKTYTYRNVTTQFTLESFWILNGLYNHPSAQRSCSTFCTTVHNLYINVYHCDTKLGYITKLHWFPVRSDSH